LTKHLNVSSDCLPLQVKFFLNYFKKKGPNSLEGELAGAWNKLLKRLKKALEATTTENELFFTKCGGRDKAEDLMEAFNNWS